MITISTSIRFLVSSILVIAMMTQSKSQNSESPVASKWIKIEDFESSDPMQQWILADTGNETNPKIEKPQVTEVRVDGEQNHYLIKKPAAEGIVGNRKALSYRKLPITVEVGETYTFYIRLNVEYFPNNHVFGWSNLNSEGIIEHDYNALEPSLRVTDRWDSSTETKNDGTLMVRKDPWYEKIFNNKTNRSARPMETNTWYEVWCVVNNAKASEGGQKYDVYIQGGDEFPEQQKVYVGADFRMKRELPLIYFLANCNTGPVDKPYGNGGLGYDDLYMAKGKVMTRPRK